MRNCEKETCKTLLIHAELVQEAEKNMPDDNLIVEIGDFFKVLGEPTRIKIINEEKELMRENN